MVDFFPNAKDADIVYELMLRQKNVPLSAKMERLYMGGIFELTFMRIVIWSVLRQRLQRN